MLLGNNFSMCKGGVCFEMFHSVRLGWIFFGTTLTMREDIGFRN
jgi:hypothetical protein